MGTSFQLKNWLLLAASVAAFLLVLEIALALFRPHKITTHPYHEQYHPVMGWVNKPDVNGEVKTAPGNFFRRSHNNRGLRSLSGAAYEKPAGTKRVLLIGDSFFWGYNVNDDEVLSEILRQRLGAGVEVLNGAVPGYGTDQELLWLAEEGLKYRPDYVILGCFPTNDWDEISHSINYGYPKPFFTIDRGRLSAMNIPVPDTRETRRKGFEEPDTAFGKIKKFLRHHTHTYQFIVGRLNRIKPLRDLFLKIGLAEEFTWDLPGVPALTLKQDQIQTLFESLVKEMNALSHENGAGFLLLFIPAKEQPRASPALYEGARQNAAAENDRFSSYLSQFTGKNRIAFLDLLPLVREHQSKGERLYTPQRYDHHWNEHGHRVAADALSDRLKKNGL